MMKKLLTLTMFLLSLFILGSLLVHAEENDEITLAQSHPYSFSFDGGAMVREVKNRKVNETQIVAAISDF